MKNHCRSCGAEIVWGETREGRRMPLNPAQKRFVFGLKTGRLLSMNTYESHFATCPDAAEHRKKDK